MRFGLPATGYLFAGLGIQRVFVILVGSMLGSAAAGYFALAFRAVDMLRDVIGGAVSQLALPLFSRAVDDAGRRRAFHAAVRLTSCVMFPVFIGLASVSDEVVVLIFGRQWLPVAPYVALMSLLTVQFFPRMFSAPLMSAIGRPALPILDVLSQIAFIVAGMFILGHASPVMAAGVWALRLLLSTPIDMIFLKRTTGLGFVEQWRGAFIPAVAATGMGVAVFALKGFIPNSLGITLRLMLTVPIAALLYVVLLQVLDRKLVKDVCDFAVAALARRRAPAVAT
jgi:PST family polysaccharide transporter